MVPPSPKVKLQRTRCCFLSPPLALFSAAQAALPTGGWFGGRGLALVVKGNKKGDSPADSPADAVVAAALLPPPPPLQLRMLRRPLFGANTD